MICPLPHKKHKGPAGGRTAWRAGWAAPGVKIRQGPVEALETLRRPETSVATAAARIRPALGERAAHFEPLIAAVARFLTRVDPPDHVRLRALVQKAFTLQAVERMDDAIVALVDSYLAP